MSTLSSSLSALSSSTVIDVVGKLRRVAWSASSARTRAGEIRAAMSESRGGMSQNRSIKASGKRSLAYRLTFRAPDRTLLVRSPGHLDQPDPERGDERERERHE